MTSLIRGGALLKLSLHPKREFPLYFMVNIVILEPLAKLLIKEINPVSSL
jgi:hypothetical protein